ncbi:MAG: ATP-binding protein [Caldisericia bacterium]|nr:ATP-binding protein [Caldisericia bacterium]
MEKTPILSETFKIKGRDYEHGGEASSKIKSILKRLGIDPNIIKRVSICAYEAEMNIIIYAYEGTLTLMVYNDMIKLIAEDIGPGIPDIELAMKEGYSTAPPEAIELGFGAGMGLPNMKNNSDRMNIETEVNKGTKVIIEVDLKNER